MNLDTVELMHAHNPLSARTMDEFVVGLRAWKTQAGNPSISQITERIHRKYAAQGRPRNEWPARSTVGDCLRVGRPRPDSDLLLAIVEALADDNPATVSLWRQALSMILGEAEAGSHVQVTDALPPEIGEFTGRGDIIGKLDEFPPTMAIEGMAGIGKTALAVHLGHRILRQHPDINTVLFANLRGFDHSGPPVNPAVALEALLRLLQVPGRQIPSTLAERGALWQAQLAQRRTLLVLDNAADDEQLRHLIPEVDGCRTLVTSRRRLSCLPSITLGALSPDESLRLLRLAVGSPRVEADMIAGNALVNLCGHVPLAIAVTGAHLRQRPEIRLADHAEHLAELGLPDEVDAALAASYEHLNRDQRQVFRLLGLHPGPDFDISAATALTTLDKSVVEDTLADLLQANLLQQTAPGRFQFHDLVRATAFRRSRNEDPPQHRRASLTRLGDHYLSTAAYCMDELYPGEKRLRPKISGTPSLDDIVTPEEWLDREAANLIAVAATQQSPLQSCHLSATLSRFLDDRGWFQDAETLHTHALRAARTLEDAELEANALLLLSILYIRIGRIALSGQYAQMALLLTRDDSLHCRIRNMLGVVETQLGNLGAAVEHYERGLEMLMDSDLLLSARIRNNLGILNRKLHEYAKAQENFLGALELYREHGRQSDLAALHINLSSLYMDLAEYQLALEHGELALQVTTTTTAQTRATGNVALACVHLGQYAKATEHSRKLLALAQEIGSVQLHAEALLCAGSVMHVMGELTQARQHLQAALPLAEQVEDLALIANAQDVLGDVALADDRPEAAIQHWHKATKLYHRLDFPDADRVAAKVAALTPGPAS